MNAAQRAQERRERMRAAGYRMIQLWVPDTRSEEYRARIKRQIQSAKHTPEEKQAVADTETYWEHVDGWEW